jgi:hypothetical protein
MQAMTPLHWLFVPLCGVLGAAAFRVRGGLTEGWRHQLPGQVARLAWGLACAIVVLLAAGLSAWWVALAVGLLTWVSTMAGLHDTIDMGHNDGTFSRDLAVGTAHGLVLGAAAAIPLALARFGGYVPHFGALVFPLWWLALIGGAAIHAKRQSCSSALSLPPFFSSQPARKVGDSSWQRHA